MRQIQVVVLLLGGLQLSCLQGFSRDAAVAPLSKNLTVLLEFEESSPAISLDGLHNELQRILDTTGMTLDLRLKSQTAAHEEFSQLVIFRMRGHCTARPLPIAALSDERGALAMTYSSDGDLLPFGEVECDRVRQALARYFGRRPASLEQAEYGTALARVMAHEIYHMLGNSSQHTRNGLTKRSLSARELCEDMLPFPEKAKQRITGNLGLH